MLKLYPAFLANLVTDELSRAEDRLAGSHPGQRRADLVQPAPLRCHIRFSDTTLSLRQEWVAKKAMTIPIFFTSQIRRIFMLLHPHIFFTDKPPSSLDAGV